jgi:hypothetical protein
MNKPNISLILQLKTKTSLFIMKKFFFLTLLSSLFTIVTFAQYPSSKMVVLVKGGKVKLNKKDVSKEWKLNTFTASIDTLSRKKENTSNKIHSYDYLGIVLFETAVAKVPTGLVGEFQLFLDATEASKSNPKEFYEGKLTIEKMDFTRNTTVEEIRAKLKDYKETESDEKDKYRFAKDGIYIYFLYNSAKKLSKVTFGKDKMK